MESTPEAQQTPLSPWGVTPAGFKLKRLYDIQQSTYAALNTVLDPVSGESLNLDPSSDDPLVQIVNTVIASMAEQWELAQVAYNSRDPLQATGAALDEIGQELGVVRRLGTKSTVELFCTGTAGFIVPVGQQVTDAYDSTVWTTTSAIVFSSTGTATVEAQPALRGPIPALAASLTAILTPRTGWNTVINTEDAELGVPDETDASYRRRILVSSMVPSSGPVDSLYSGIASVAGVTYTRVYQNRDVVADSRGLIAKSIGAVVVGGDDNEIGKEIYLRSAAGLSYSGNTNVTVTDFQGVMVNVSFYRPVEVPIKVSVTVRVTDASLWPSDGAEQIKAAILLYAQGGAPALDVNVGFTPYGFVPGIDVVASLLYTPVNSVPGHAASSLLIGIGSGALSEDDIPIEWNALATFDSSRITVIVT